MSIKNDGRSGTKATKGKKRKKQANVGDADVDDGNHGDDEATPGPKKKRARVETADPTSKKVSRKRTKTKHAAANASDAATESQAPAKPEGNGTSERTTEPKSLPVNGNGQVVAVETGAAEPESARDDPSACFLDVSLWKEGREALDGSFSAAREHFTSRGPWKLPKTVGEGRFGNVAKLTLSRMKKHDTYSLFAEPVSAEEVPDYFEVIKHPMDYSSMEKKIEDGAYGKGSDAMTGLYNDFMLVFDNCAQYNEENGEVCVEAARMLGLLPEAYVVACAAVAKKKKTKK